MNAFVKTLCILSLTVFCGACGGGSGGEAKKTIVPATPPPEEKIRQTIDNVSYWLQFEAQSGANAEFQALRNSLSTDHRTLSVAPGRTCPGVPETDDVSWYVEVIPDQVGDEFIYTSTGKITLNGPAGELTGPALSNLLIDIFNEPSSTPVQFTRTCPDTNAVKLDGCFGSTPVNAGLLTYSIRTIGDPSNLSCQSQVSLDFSHCTNDQAVEEFLRIQTGWMTSNRVPASGPNGNCQAGIHTIDTTGGDSVQFYRMQTIDGVPTIMEQDVRDMGMFITVLTP
jgi:hypothetical protein